MLATMEAAAAAAAIAGNADNTVGVLSVDEACAEELKRFMAAPVLGIRTKVDSGYVWQDPLAWWKMNQVACPILAGLAKVYLAVQATSAPSERVFSIASRVISNRRTRLNPSLAGKMLFVSESWKWWQDQLDFCKACEDEVVEVMEE